MQEGKQSYYRYAWDVVGHQRERRRAKPLYHFHLFLFFPCEVCEMRLWGAKEVLKGKLFVTKLEICLLCCDDSLQLRILFNVRMILLLKSNGCGSCMPHIHCRLTTETHCRQSISMIESFRGGLKGTEPCARVWGGENEYVIMFSSVALCQNAVRCMHKGWRGAMNLQVMWTKNERVVAEYLVSMFCIILFSF